MIWIVLAVIIVCVVIKVITPSVDHTRRAGGVYSQPSDEPQREE